MRDLYVSLGEPVGDGAWGVRVYHKPFVDWIWGGCLPDGRWAASSRSPTGATARARRPTVPAGAAAAGRERMKALKYIIPLAVFLALVAFFAVGLTRDPRDGALALHRQARARSSGSSSCTSRSSPSRPRT